MTTSNDEEPAIICLNYCVYDEESGYCLTCGRPPIPVTPWSPTPTISAGDSASTATQESKPE